MLVEPVHRISHLFVFSIERNHNIYWSYGTCQPYEVGYNLLNDGQLEPALFVFQLNNRLYPESANTWDSLAEANWKAGRIEKAIELYNRAIELDPDGAVGDNAREMLKKIEQGDQ